MITGKIMSECIWERSFDGHFNIGCVNETKKRANGNFKGEEKGATWEFIYCPYCGRLIKEETT